MAYLNLFPVNCSGLPNLTTFLLLVDIFWIIERMMARIKEIVVPSKYHLYEAITPPGLALNLLKGYAKIAARGSARCRPSSTPEFQKNPANRLTIKRPWKEGLS